MGERKRKLAFASAAVVLLGITAFLTLARFRLVAPGRCALRATSRPVRDPNRVARRVGVGRDQRPARLALTRTAGAVDGAVRRRHHARRRGSQKRARRRAPRGARGGRRGSRVPRGIPALQLRPRSTRSGFGRPRSRCFASWRRRRRACRRASPTLARSSSPCVPRRRPAVRTSTSWPWSRMAGGGTASRSRCATRAAAGS